MCFETKKRFVLVGDACCGKTALAARISQDLFFGDDYIPTNFDDYSAAVSTKNGTCQLTILDTSGLHEDVSGVRSQAYEGCDAVIICFDLTDRNTLESVETKWVPEVMRNCPGVPFYIAGCKKDAVCDESRGCTCSGASCCTQTEENLEKLFKRTGAVAYGECSSKTAEDVVEIFQAVAETAAVSKKTNAKNLVACLKKKAGRGLRRLSRPSRA